ncbi:UDP-glucose/GDP-mannose dehydrogenase family, UDP binding domain [compost metagenome]
MDVYDPWAIASEVKEEYGITLKETLEDIDYKAIIIAVAHDEFLNLDYEKYKERGAIIFDTKSFIDRRFADARL